MIYKVKAPDQKTQKDKWLAIRKSSIGGSEISAIMGMNPFESAYGLYQLKVGEKDDFEGNLATKVGTYLEEFVAQLFTEVTGLKVQRTNFFWKNDRYPELHASPDRLIKGREAGLEIKTTSAFNGKKFHNDMYPAQYFLQACHYMLVTGLNEWFIAVLIGNQDFRIYRIVRGTEIDEKPAWCTAQELVPESLFEDMYKAAHEFWKRVISRNPPDPDGSEATTEAIKEKYAQGGEGGSIFLTGDRELLIDEYMMLDEQIGDIEKRQTEIKNILCNDLGDNESGKAGQYTVSWKRSERKTLDSKKLIADHPEMSCYYKVSSSRTFKIKTTK